jgi:hypothetical protein
MAPPYWNAMALDVSTSTAGLHSQAATQENEKDNEVLNPESH